MKWFFFVFISFEILIYKAFKKAKATVSLNKIKCFSFIIAYHVMAHYFTLHRDVVSIEGKLLFQNKNAVTVRKEWS